MEGKELLEKIKQYPAALVFGVLAIVLIAGAQFSGGALDQQKKEINRLGSIEQAMNFNRIQAVSLNEHVEEIKQLTEAANASLISRGRTPNRIYLEALGNETNVRVANVAQSATPADAKAIPPEKSYKHYSVVDFQLTAYGTFNDILSFLHRLETDKYFAEIHSVDFSIDSSFPDRLDVTIEFDVLSTPLTFN